MIEFAKDVGDIKISSVSIQKQKVKKNRWGKMIIIKVRIANASGSRVRLVLSAKWQFSVVV